MIKKLSGFIQWAINRFAPKHDEIDFWPFPVDEKVKPKQVKKVTVPKATTRTVVKKKTTVAKKATPKKKAKAK